MDTDNTTEITQRQQMINEVMEDLVATKTDIVLCLKWNKIWETADKTKDISLLKSAHMAVGLRVVAAVMKAQETKDPECPVYEWSNAGDIFRKVEHIVHLFEQGEEPQNTDPDGYREWQQEEDRKNQGATEG